MDTVKEQAARLVELLPDTATWDDLMYQIYVRQKKVSAGDRPAHLRGRGQSTSPEAVSEGGSTFPHRWRGKFVPADRDDERYKALAKRYL